MVSQGVCTPRASKTSPAYHTVVPRKPLSSLTPSPAPPSFRFKRSKFALVPLGVSEAQGDHCAAAADSFVPATTGMKELVLSARRFMHDFSLAGQAMRASPFGPLGRLTRLGLPLRVVDPWLVLAVAGLSLVVLSCAADPIMSTYRGGKAWIHQSFSEFALPFKLFLFLIFDLLASNLPWSFGHQGRR